MRAWHQPSVPRRPRGPVVSPMASLESHPWLRVGITQLVHAKCMGPESCLRQRLMAIYGCSRAGMPRRPCISLRAEFLLDPDGFLPSASRPFSAATAGCVWSGCARLPSSSCAHVSRWWYGVLFNVPPRRRPGVPWQARRPNGLQKTPSAVRIRRDAASTASAARTRGSERGERARFTFPLNVKLRQQSARREVP